MTDDVTEFGDHRVELLDGAAAMLWRAEGLRRQPAGGFAILLPTGPLSPGAVELRLSGLGADGWLPIATFRFPVRATVAREGHSGSPRAH